MIDAYARTLPVEIQCKIAGAALQAVTIGCSGNEVFHVGRHNKPNSYLKIAPQHQNPDLTAEKSKLDWLQGKLPVPQVEAFTTTGTHTYLLLSEVPGLISCAPAFADKVPAVIRALAEGMRTIHALSINDCPFDQRLDTMLDSARYRTEQGLVDTADFDEARQGEQPADLITFLQTHRPLEDIVLTHGDYCLPNVLIDHATTHISGFIDLHRVGIADRYQDIALAVHSLVYNFGSNANIQTKISDANLAEMLYAEYGLDKPYHDRVEYYQVLDEFF